MELVKEKLDAQKLRGGYYTPSPITEFLSKWAIQSKNDSVLEPSCGDGNFIEAALSRLSDLGASNQDLAKKIRGVEFLEEEAEKARLRAVKNGGKANSIINSDFFSYINGQKDSQYDVVIGNPPFIRYQNFPHEHRDLAFEMMNELGLQPNKLTNIWVPFLVVSASLLKDNGRLAMVIPAELFQVKYAAETRVFLSKFFDRITIVTFKKLVFKGIQQEVVLILAEKTVSKGKGIRTIECEHLEDLHSIDFEKINGTGIKPVDHSTEKWTKYFLTEKEIQLLKRLKKDPRIIPMGNIMEVDVGLVTGRNEFFMMRKADVSKWKLSKYTIPVASKSNQIKGIRFSEKDLLDNSDNEQATHLFMPPNEDFEKLPKACQRYIKYGEEQGFHTGYKCRIRKKWYITPSLWIPDGFALRQVGDYPKLALNESSATSTDTIHRVRFKKGVDKKLATVSFLNSLSFAFSEITGRSYGGGVLTFEPTEIEEIPIPKLQSLDIDFKKIDTLIRRRDIEAVLDIVDSVLLKDKYGFSNEEVAMLRSIWVKLRNRRTQRKHSTKAKVRK